MPNLRTSLTLVLLACGLLGLHAQHYYVLAMGGLEGEMQLDEPATNVRKGWIEIAHVLPRMEIISQHTKEEWRLLTRDSSGQLVHQIKLEHFGNAWHGLCTSKLDSVQIDFSVFEEEFPTSQMALFRIKKENLWYYVWRDMHDVLVVEENPLLGSGTKFISIDPLQDSGFNHWKAWIDVPRIEELPLRNQSFSNPYMNCRALIPVISENFNMRLTQWLDAYQHYATQAVQLDNKRAQKSYVLISIDVWNETIFSGTAEIVGDQSYARSQNLFPFIFNRQEDKFIELDYFFKDGDELNDFLFDHFGQAEGFTVSEDGILLQSPFQSNNMIQKLVWEEIPVKVKRKSIDKLTD